MRYQLLLSPVIFSLFLIGCSTVDVTKTSKGYDAPTNPNEVEILVTKPDRKFRELATLSVSGFSQKDTAKMHNALRSKAAPLGASAVVITASGLIPDGWGQYTQWANAVAVKWQ